MDHSRSSALKSRYADIAVLVLAGACAVLLWTNYALQKRNHLLSDQFRSLSTALGPPVGSKISVLGGTTISGQKVALDLLHRDKLTLLLILSPQCKYTQLNFPNWQDLLPLVSADQVVYVDLSGTADSTYLASRGIATTATVIRLDPEQRTLYSFSATPTTILLDAHATVKAVWPGLMRDEQVNEVRTLLSNPKA